MGPAPGYQQRQQGGGNRQRGDHRKAIVENQAVVLGNIHPGRNENQPQIGKQPVGGLGDVTLSVVSGRRCLS